jgi:antitoxin HicB
MSKPENPHIGPTFQSWLEEEGIAEEVEDRALSELLALQLDDARKSRGLTKTRMANRMNTTRAELDRLLSGKNTTLGTVQKAARAVGKIVRIQLVDAPSEKDMLDRAPRSAARAPQAKRTKK